MPEKRLRHGFTTGSAAAAGAKAGVLYLGGRGLVRKVEIPLPIGGRLMVPISTVSTNGKGCSVTVIKDAGDDPDVTHKARITSIVRLLPEGKDGEIIIKGGRGVGKVTRPGLPVPVGEWAINPVPRRQITEAVLEGLNETGVKGAVSVIIEVINGERIAKKTLNPRLGIIGGISILGTRGTVKPFSNQAYKDTITMSMDVARAAELSTIALATGAKSERFLKEQRPNLPDISFIQVADFFSLSLKEANKRGFKEILYSCFFGKLIKMAQGYPYTHARRSEIDFNELSDWCMVIGMDRDRANRIRKANTAREALGLILEDNNRDAVIRDITKKALFSARRFAGSGPEISFYLFDFEGSVLANLTDTGVNK